MRRTKLKGVALFLRKVEGLPEPEYKVPTHNLPGHINKDRFLELLTVTDGCSEGSYVHGSILDCAFTWDTCQNSVDWYSVCDNEVLSAEAAEVLDSWRCYTIEEIEDRANNPDHTYHDDEPEEFLTFDDEEESVW